MEIIEKIKSIKIKSIFFKYWIILMILIFYSIGISIHFIAQEGLKIKNLEKGEKPQIIEEINEHTNIDTNEETKFKKPDNIFYFMQITDIHISNNYNYGSYGHFLFFLKKILPLINPTFLFVTGDITNSMNGLFDIGTLEEEWKMYYKTLNEAGMLSRNNGTFYWDIRGNHDCFKVPHWDSEYNYFNKYSKTKSNGFNFLYKTPYGTYSFAGLDGCPKVTTTNPFFGTIDTIDMDNYTKLMDEAKKENATHKFVFAHYPEMTIKFGESSSGKKWSDYRKDISIYFSGHFHNIAGSRMYSFHKDFLELELFDMKMKAAYRIVSVDNDIVSFSDKTLPLKEIPYTFGVGINDLLKSPPAEIFNTTISPIVHITSPKNSNIVLSKNEPIMEALKSNYIRVLVFSSLPKSNITLSLWIDDEKQLDTKFEFVGNAENNNSTNTEGNNNTERLININGGENIQLNTTIPPLWIAKWDNSKYKDNKSHKMQIKAIDTNKQEGEHTIIFRMDSKRDETGVPKKGANFLKLSFVTILPILFWIIYTIIEVFFIIIPGFYSIQKIKTKYSNLPKLPNKYIGDIISESTKKLKKNIFLRIFFIPFLEAYSIDGIFYPIQFFLLFILVFPTTIGVLTRSYQGISKVGGQFVYGAYMSGSWIPVYDQYAFSLFYMIGIFFFNLIVIIYVNQKRKRIHIISMIILGLICVIQTLISVVHTIVSTGILGFFLSPFPIWYLIYSWTIIIMITVKRIKNKDQPIQLSDTVNTEVTL